MHAASAKRERGCSRVGAWTTFVWFGVMIVGSVLALLGPDRIVLRSMHPEIDDGKLDFLDVEGELYRIILQEPLKEGAKWRTMSGIRSWQSFVEHDEATAGDEALDDGKGYDGYVWETRRIETVGQTLVTPAGTFPNVIAVRVIPDQGAPSLEHYAPGVGLIRSEHHYGEELDGEASYEWRIISALAVFRIGRN